MPQSSASSTVRPAVECTSASAAASHSHMRSVKPSTRTRGSPAWARASRSRTRSLVPHRQTATAPGNASTAAAAASRSPIPQPPPEMATTGAPAGRPSAARAASRDGGALVLRPHEAAHVADVGARAGDRRDLGARLRVDDQVQVDARVRPPVQRGQVGDGRGAGDGEPAGSPQPPERLGGAGIGRDDRVRRLAGDQRPQPAAAQRRDQPLEQAPRARPAGDQPVLGVEQPRGVVQHPLQAALRHGLDAHPAGGHRVGHRRLRAPLPQGRGEQFRRQVVAGADVGREDEDPGHAARLWRKPCSLPPP